MTICDFLFTLQGLLVVFCSLLQYSILYYAAFLAFVDFRLVRNIEKLSSDYSRYTLLALTIIFTITTTHNMLKTICDTLRQMTATFGDKMIVDVLTDITAPGRDSAAVLATRCGPSIEAPNDYSY